MATNGARGPRRSRRSARPACSTAAPSETLARYHRPAQLDPHGRIGAETVAEFELAPIGRAHRLMAPGLGVAAADRCEARLP